MSFSGESRRVKRHKNGIMNLLCQQPQEAADFWMTHMYLSAAGRGSFLETVSHKKFCPMSERQNFLAYINTNCRPNRERLFQLIRQRHSGAHALGKCSNTGHSISKKFNVLPSVYNRYRFGFAMENCDQPAYLTEKMIYVYSGGAIPIFWGDSKVAKFFFNPETFVDVSDFSSLDRAAEHIVELDKNREKLSRMQSLNIFRNGVVPPYLKDPNKLIEDISQMLRRNYAAYLLQLRSV